MKKTVLIACFFTAGNLFAQQKLVTQAIVNATTTIVAPDESEDVANIQQSEGPNRVSFRNFSDGETKSVTYLKNDLIKTVLKSEMGRSTIIRDNAAKKTTTLIELMGNKTGFYTTDEEAANMRKRADSMMQASQKNGDSTRRINRNTDVPTEVVYTEETKKIAGYVCKKAYLVSTRLLGIKDSTLVWYTPELKLNNVSNVGGLSGMTAIMGSGGSMAALSKIDGFVMSYQSKMPRNRTMTVEVTKIDLNKEITDKEFDIPKDFDVKPMSEMRGMMQGGPGSGGGQIRMFRSN
ncbi:MAG TPA: hypothetical protein PK504_08125 [Ferruginibacter sp.]|nr:hypothetical protein [Ferruginibacter sp.]HRE63837.1 hypothetical protein [Ferruginibacter sp.]